MVHTIEEAEALAAVSMGRVCRICAAMEEKTKAFDVCSPWLRRGKGGEGVWAHTCLFPPRS